MELFCGKFHQSPVNFDDLFSQRAFRYLGRYIVYTRNRTPLNLFMFCQFTEVISYVTSNRAMVRQLLVLTRKSELSISF